MLERDALDENGHCSNTEFHQKVIYMVAERESEHCSIGGFYHGIKCGKCNARFVPQMEDPEDRTVFCPNISAPMFACPFRETDYCKYALCFRCYSDGFGKGGGSK